MTNIQDKLNNIISELEFIKNNIKRDATITEFCLYFRLALIFQLEQTGAIYDPTLEHIWCHAGSNTKENKKFFAFKKSEIPTEQEILDKLKMIYEILSEYMSDFGDLKNLAFNITKIEGLRDRDDFSVLIRGILVVKVVKECQ